MDHLQEEVDAAHIYSNGIEAVFIHHDLKLTGWPEAKQYSSGDRRQPAASIAGTWPGSHTAYLVWFDNLDSSHLYSVEELKQIADIDVVAEFEDGTIYEVTAR